MGEAQNISSEITSRSSILPHKLGISKLILTSHVGLIVVVQLMQRLGLAQLVDRQLPAPGGNRGCWQGTSYHLQKEQPLMQLLGCGQLLGAKTLGNWLRRVGRSAQGMQGLVNINKTSMLT